MNNETIGISTEVAIADAFGIEIDENYRSRGNEGVITLATPIARGIARFVTPTKHVGTCGNSVDFMAGKKTISVKSNLRNMGMIAPQEIGQATSRSFWREFSQFLPEMPETYKERAVEFKHLVLSNPAFMLGEYWKKLFGSDYLVVFYQFYSRETLIAPSLTVFPRVLNPVFEDDMITFTRKADTWRESTTVRYNNISIGNFQVHNNRDNFKFRFQMAGIVKAFPELFKEKS